MKIEGGDARWWGPLMYDIIVYFKHFGATACRNGEQNGGKRFCERTGHLLLLLMLSILKQ